MSVTTTAVAASARAERVRAQSYTSRNDANVVPPLQSGDRLTRAEFEHRYEAHPDIKKAELIEGVVYVPSPVSLDHADTHAIISFWVASYWAATPGIRVADNATVRLDFDNEVQPDISVRIAQANLDRRERFLEQAPSLIIEVAASSASYDLHQKRHVYRRSGVREYLVLALHERETYWFELVDGEYVRQQPSDEGLLQSSQFPGLWLDVDALWADDLPRLVATLQRGLATPEHAEFVAELAAAQPT